MPFCPVTRCSLSGGAYSNSDVCNNLVDFTFYDDFCDVYKNNKLATCKRTPIHDDKTVDESKCDVCKAKDTPAQ
ncbi:hypothetical protein FPSE_03934 [Fusarium pseudograminearum CS3096]|uniref:Uncharacterized protein n=1 Tax=Fusarium pseudograminearum (strain CS3096) TaxID=1028729 RepID=K3VM81_FUSPC|nr:hypothetical protein FPSE_03934 [Fusarium pseudograminearum CS3096]EKJ75754.1 hypothetical protein FPSE_03934 [Fusarium pseudograminearum CS3096]